MSKTKKKKHFRALPGSPGYRVSDDGEVQSCWLLGRYAVIGVTWHTMQPHVRYGRPRLRIWNRRKTRRMEYTIGRLVLLAWRGPAPVTKPYVLHRNGRMHDDRLSNLAWSKSPQRRKPSKA